MTLLLTEADVRSLLTMSIALDAVEESLRELGKGELTLHPRRRIRLGDGGLLNYMAAGDPIHGYIGMKLYTIAKGTARFVMPLFSSTTGEMSALIEADALGQIRTGAASGVAAKYLSNPDARIAGIVGTGYQAQTQLEAIAAVRKIERARAFGRNPERRAQFCRRMTERIGVPVEAAGSCEEAVCGADLVITATTATQVVLQGPWVAPGMHITAMGANWAQKRELDAAAVNRADVIVADSVEQSKMEAGDLIQAFGEDPSRWSTVKELGGIVAGTIPGRTSPNQITLFKSNGIATWDVAVAARVYELAIKRGIGQRVPLWQSAAGM